MKRNHEEVQKAREWFLENKTGTFAILKEDWPATAHAIQVLLDATGPTVDDRNHDELAERIADELAGNEAGDSDTLSAEHEIEFVRRVLSWLSDHGTELKS